MTILDKFLSTSLSASICLMLLGCADSRVENKEAEPSEIIAAETKPPQQPTFADMVNINSPMAVVEGGDNLIHFESKIDPALQSKVSDLAVETGSYGVIVSHKGTIIAQDYQHELGKNVKSESASMHKSVLALLIGIAIDEGDIKSVMEPVGTYITEWSGDPRGDITIRSLLEMNSRLKPLSREGGMESAAVKFIFDGPSAKQAILNMELRNETGAVFHYQNTDSQLLGLILERATSTAYETYLSEKLWKVIGAKDAHVWLNEADGFPRMYTGLYATPEDWLKLGSLIKDYGMIGGQQVVSSNFVTRMTKPSEANPNYGWQIWRGATYESTRYYNDEKSGYSVMASEPFILDDLIYFDGFGGQRVFISRKCDLIIVRLGDAKMDWDDSVLPNMISGHLCQPIPD